MASDTFQTFGGLLNNSGYLSVAGHHKIDTDLNEKDYLKEGQSIELPWITGPSPQTLFKAKSKPNVKSFVHPDKNCPELGIEHSISPVVFEFKHAPQGGYKLKGADGTYGVRGTDFTEVCGGPVEWMNARVSDRLDNVLVFDDDVINTEAARYRWGLQEEPPRYGLGLPGSSQILQRSHTPGKIIVAHPRNGYARESGYHSGWQSMQYNASGTLDPVRSF